MTNFAYATDEDVALRAPADFALLTPRDQKLAAGSDGTFAPSDRWTLRSGSVNFEAAGVAPGHVILLLGPTSQYRPPGEALAVQAVAGNAVTLRRKGQPPGSGQAPGPGSGADGVEFSIVTLAPQIRIVAADFDRRFGLPPGAAAGRLDSGDVRDVIVLSVLHDQYLAISRDAAGPSRDGFGAKALTLKAERDEILARLVVRRGDGGDPTSRFSTRLSR